MYEVFIVLDTHNALTSERGIRLPLELVFPGELAFHGERGNSLFLPGERGNSLFLPGRERTHLLLLPGESRITLFLTGKESIVILFLPGEESTKILFLSGERRNILLKFGILKLECLSRKLGKVQGLLERHGLIVARV